MSPPPEPPAQDLVRPAAEAGAYVEALDRLMGLVRSPEGREEIRSVLTGRLGDGTARMRKRGALKGRATDDKPLLRGLISALGLPETSEVAEEMVRILGVAVDRGTSDPIMREALETVLIMVTEPGGRAPAPPSRPGPAPAAPVTPPLAPRAPARQAEYDPHGPFRLPGRVVRFGELGGMLAAPLIPASGEARGPGPVRVPAALPPPPETGDPELIRGWLRGTPPFCDSIAMRVGLLDTGDPGDLMEIEAEFHKDPVAALRLYRAAAPIADGTSDAAWCARLGRDIGRFGVTHERAVETLALALRARVLDGPENRRDVLARSGTVLVVREELAEAVCGLIDAEADFLADGPADPGGPPQNLMGSFSPNADLSEGRCLERALFLHLSAAVPLGSAMRQSLTEFRLAQAMRANPAAPFAALAERHERDPALPLAELSGRVPIVRIGYSEPVLT